VLYNLLSNAYKYSDGGEVRVSVAPHGRWLKLSVSDQGMGMTPDQLARVTERFYRADSSGHVLGTGLGMSIVREIVDLHAGRLELHSQPGQGSCISVLLPLSSADAAVASAA